MNTIIYHRRIKMRPSEVKWGTFIDFYVAK